jgi:hypothetical protein
MHLIVCFLFAFCTCPLQLLLIGYRAACLHRLRRRHSHDRFRYAISFLFLLVVDGQARLMKGQIAAAPNRQRPLVSIEHGR